MGSLFFLAGQSLRHRRGQTAVLVFGLAVPIYLVLAVNGLVLRYQDSLVRRAEATPLVAGGPGSRFDLVLHALYFRGRVPHPLKMADLAAMRETGYALPIPLHVRHTARRFPVVGTTLDYFAFRRLEVAVGGQLLQLGDCVLGAAAAAELRLGPGGRLPTDPDNLFDLAGSYPVKLLVRGVLSSAGTPDDRAVFVDLKTAWLLDGLCHGHADVTGTNTEAALLLARTATNVTAGAAVPEDTEVTPGNIASFHLHGDPADLPVSAVLPVAPDARSATLLRGRYQAPESTVQILAARGVVEELLGLVLRIKRFFDANALLVAVSTGLFLILVVLLSLRLRRAEMETLFRIGCARGFTVRLVGLELGLVASMALLVAGAGIAITFALAPAW